MHSARRQRPRHRSRHQTAGACPTPTSARPATPVHRGLWNSLLPPRTRDRFARQGKTGQARPLPHQAIEIYERLDAVRDLACAEALLRAAEIRRGRRGLRGRPQIGWASLTPPSAPSPGRVAAVAGGGVRLVRHRAARPAPGPAQAAPGDADRVHQRDEPRRAAVLAGAGQPGDRAAAQVSGQVNPGGQPAPGPADRLPARFPVIRQSPPCGHQQPGRGGPRPHADAPGQPWSPR